MANVETTPSLSEQKVAFIHEAMVAPYGSDSQTRVADAVRGGKVSVAQLQQAMAAKGSATSSLTAGYWDTQVAAERLAADKSLDPAPTPTPTSTSSPSPSP